MYSIHLFLVLLLITIVNCRINTQELRCLVCEATVTEMEEEVRKLDPNRKINVGSFRLDASGNFKHKTVAEDKSEMQLSEVADAVCGRMDDYIRATWKSNGSLTLVKLLIDGNLNPDMSNVDIIQDDDLNKSLKYYCEEVFENYEDSIIQHFQSDSDNIPIRVCSLEAKLCKKTVPVTEKEELPEKDEL